MRIYRLLVITFVIISNSVVTKGQSQLQGVVNENAYLANAALSRMAYDYSKKTHFADKVGIKNQMADSLLRAVDDIRFTAEYLSKGDSISKPLKSILAEMVKKSNSIEGKVKEAKKMATGSGKDAALEKAVYATGDLVVDAYFALLSASDAPPGKKDKLPKNADQVDSLELLKADKTTNFLFMKEYIKYNSFLAVEIKFLQKMLKEGLTKEEKVEIELAIEQLKVEKDKNDRLLRVTVERLDETREKIVETILVQNNLKEEFVLFDEDKNGKISVEEVYAAIEKHMAGKISFSPEMIDSLIDFYFDFE